MTILTMDRGHPRQLLELNRKFNVVSVQDGETSQDVIAKHAPDIRGVSTFLTPVRKNIIDALPNLEIIALGAVGTDHVDLRAAWERNIKVTNTPGVLTDDTADMAMMLMHMTARKGVRGHRHVESGAWERREPIQLGVSLKGKTMGIVGLGEIGAAVAKRAEAHGMKIVYHGPSEKRGNDYQYYPRLRDMAAASDFLMLTCPGGDGTRHIVNRDVLSALGQKGYLINVARGSVVEQPALIDALRNETIAGAGLDVFDDEPNVPEELRNADNAVLSPHMASATHETRTDMGALANRNLIAHFGGEPLLTPVTPRNG